MIAPVVSEIVAVSQPHPQMTRRRSKYYVSYRREGRRCVIIRDVIRNLINGNKDDNFAQLPYHPQWDSAYGVMTTGSHEADRIINLSVVRQGN